MTSPVSTQVRIIAELRERLKTDFKLEDGDDVLEDSLEGASDLPELLARMAREAIQAEAFSEAIGHIIEAHGKRAARLDRKAESLRKQIAWALEESGWKRLPADACPEMTVSVGKGKAPLIIDDESKLPRAFREWEMVWKTDRKTLRKFLEGGGALDVARLGNAAPVLTIRTR